MRTAYLIASINSLLEVTGVRVTSEPPWGLTRHYLHGKWTNTLACIYESHADSYADASRDCWDFYLRVCDPALVARFPPPKDEVGDATAEVIS